MTGLNKYGELEDCSCPECGEPVQPRWKVCPECGCALLSTSQDRVGRSINQFECPGCGEKSNAQDGVLCKSCCAFVHFECFIQGATIGVDSEGYRGWKWLCPVCQRILWEGARSKYKGCPA